MKPVYYLTMPRPEDPRLDAAVQEVELLREEIGGEVEYLYPGRSYRFWRSRRRLPRQQRRVVARHDETASVHHVVSDRLRTYDAFAGTRNPTVLRLLTPPQPSDRRLGFSHLSAVVVSSATDAATLEEWGAGDVVVIPPAVDVERFRAVPLPADGPFTLLMASSPWTRRQFRTKGVDALLAAVENAPGVRLVLLWRHAETDSIRRRIARSRASARIELIDGYADVAEVMARVHAVALPAASAKVVKGFPHSLLEAIAARRPVLVSSALRISELVAGNGCGVVTGAHLRGLDADLARLRSDWADLQRAASRVDLEPFTRRRFVHAYRDLYARIAGES